MQLGTLMLFLAVDLSSMAFGQSTVTVGSGKDADFSTLQEAVDHASAEGEIIRIAPGTYRERLHIGTPNIRLIGTGSTPQDVVLSWHDSAGDAGGTGKSASVTVSAVDFGAENLTIKNSWERDHPNRGQGAVALLLNSDRAILDRVRILGAQDTLYANSGTCHDNPPPDGGAPPAVPTACQASRQFFKDCYVEGHVDYIFGNADAVFQNCELHSLPHGGRHHHRAEPPLSSRKVGLHLSSLPHHRGKQR